MHISTRGRYGTRAMLSLAAQHNGEFIPTCNIAEEQEVSRKYLERLLGSLRQAGLVVSEKGMRGGYKLARPPQEISVYDILVPLDENLDIVFCTDSEDACHRMSGCATRKLWLEVRDAVERILRRTSLADLVDNLEGLDSNRSKEQHAGGATGE